VAAPACIPTNSVGGFQGLGLIHHATSST